MKIPDSCMALLFGTPFDYMPDSMDVRDLFFAMESTACILYYKPRARRYRLLFLRALINEHKRKEELMPHYDKAYRKAYPDRA